MASNKNKGKKQQKKEFFLIRWIKGMFSFFAGVKIELKKVTWPTSQDLVQHTGVVILLVVFFAIFFFVMDLGIGSLKNLLY